MELGTDTRSGGVKNWELRPGGMLVQKRTDAAESPPPMIWVRVKYGAVYNHIHINSQSTFGELKKLLVEQTGIHHQDQKLFYKNKERDSKEFLDSAGVKNKSKLILMEDPISIEKRQIQVKKINHVRMEVDKLAHQVSELETVVSKGGNVAEDDVVKLTDSLMNQLLILEKVSANGDTELQRIMQVKRVQMCVETLDILKNKNSSASARKDGNEAHKQSGSSNEVVITTKWETFDSTPVSLMDAPSTSTSVPNFTWNLL